MSITVGQIEALLTLRDEMSPKLQIAASNLDRTGQSFSKAGKSLMPLSLALGAAGFAAVKFATDLNESMANVATLIPGNVDRVDELKRAVQDMAIATGKGTSDISEGLYQVVSAFGDSADTAKILETNVKAAAAGMATTSDAIALTSAVTKAYNTTTAEGVAAAADMAFMTVKLGQTSFPELASAIGKVAIGAAGLKISQEELNAVFATMTGVTGSAAEVATQFRGAMTGLKKPSDAMAATLKAIGFETGEAAIASLGFQGTLLALKDEVGGNAGEMAKLFESTESWDFIAGLAGSQADTFSGKLGEMEGFVGTLSEALDEQQNGINAAGFQWEVIKQKIAVAAQTFGDTLLPVLTRVGEALIPMIDRATSIIEKFSEMSEPVQLAGVAIFGLGVAIGPVLLILGKFTIALSALAGTQAAGIGLAAVKLGLHSVVQKMPAFLTVMVQGRNATGQFTVATRALSVSMLGPAGLVVALALAAATALKLRDDMKKVEDPMLRFNIMFDLIKKGVDSSNTAIDAHIKEMRFLASLWDGTVTPAVDRFSAGMERWADTVAMNAAAAAKAIAEKLKALEEQTRLNKEAQDELNAAMARFTTDANIEAEVRALSLAMETGEVPAKQLAAAYTELVNKIREAGLEAPASLAALMSTDEGFKVLAAVAYEASQNIELIPMELDKANKVLPLFEGHLDNATAAALAFSNTLGEAEEPGETFRETLTSIVAQLPSFIDGIETAFGISLPTAVSGFVNAATIALKGGEGSLTNALDVAATATGTFSQAGESALNALSQFMQKNWIAAATSAIAAFVALFEGIFGKVASAMEHAAEQWGIQLSESLAAAIDAAAAALGGGAGTLDAAFRLLMADAIAEATISSIASLESWALKVHHTLSSVDEGLISLDEAVDAMAASWMALVPAFAETGANADVLKAQIQDLIARGVDLDAIAVALEPVIESMFAAGVEGAQELVDWLIEAGVEFENLADSTTMAAEAADEAQAAFEAWEDAILTIEDIKQQILDLNAETYGMTVDSTKSVRDWMQSIGADTSRTFQDIRRNWVSIGQQMGWSNERIQAQIRKEWQATKGAARDAFTQIAKDSGLTGAELDADVKASMAIWRQEVRQTERDNRKAARLEAIARRKELRALLAEAKEHERSKRDIFKKTIDKVSKWNGGLAADWKDILDEMLKEARDFGKRLAGSGVIPEAIDRSAKSFDDLERHFGGTMGRMSSTAAATFLAPAGPAKMSVSRGASSSFSTPSSSRPLGTVGAPAGVGGGGGAVSADNNADVVREIRGMRRDMRVLIPAANAVATRHAAQTVSRGRNR